MSIIADAHYNWVKGYSQKHTIGYIANTCSKHINSQILSCMYEIYYNEGLL
jgi:hypothetical protein